ncbi:angiopoietin-1 receptor-like [Branchiostoma lanceolatum]|uniref:angiopoietin-1 receptor-like n=1 Tax=Branchiostoma lanceolatum TaxID=7740 RepID=UPI003453C3F9
MVTIASSMKTSITTNRHTRHGVDVAILNQYPLIPHLPSDGETFLTCITDGTLDGRNYPGIYYFKVDYSPAGLTGFTRWRSTDFSVTGKVTTRLYPPSSPDNSYRTEIIGVFSCSGIKDAVTRKVSTVKILNTDCPSNSTGPDCSTPCLCYHGGWCDDSGTCICPPGFTGDNCELACDSADQYGQTCQWSCNDGEPVRPCRKSLICLPDPYGCECANGYKGFDCDTACDTNEYGPGCTNQCNCANGGICDVNKGCLCTGDWRGPTCQEKKFRISVNPPSVHISAAAQTIATVTCSCHPWTTNDCQTLTARVPGNEVALAPISNRNGRQAKWAFTPLQRLGQMQLECSVAYNGVYYTYDAVIDITGMAPFIVFNPRDVEVNLRQSVIVTCGAGGDPQPNGDDSTLTKSDNTVTHPASHALQNTTGAFSIFEFNEVSHDLDGEYTCNVRTIAGDISSQPITIAVKVPPSPMIKPTLADVGLDYILININSLPFGGDGPIEKMALWYQQLPVGQMREVDVPPRQPQFQLSNLTQDTEYNITVVLTRPGTGGTGREGPSNIIRTAVPVHGGWSDWDDWSPCSVSCGNGTRTRTRTCDNPSPAFGGQDCEGRNQHVEPCPDQLVCPKEESENIRQDDIAENVAPEPLTSRHHTKHHALKPLGMNHSQPSHHIPMKTMTMKDRELTWDDISLTSKLLGTGNFGEVRKGTVNLEGEMIPSAIKILKRGADEASRQDFQQEVDIMRHVGYHPNIINLLGTCDHQGQQYMALEMAGNGDLKKYLRTSRVLKTTDPAYANIRQTANTVSILSPVQLLRIACDVATGMDHLSSKDVIHRDLAARNVLLTDSLIAKVADFGLSRGEGIYEQTSKKAVPFRSTALEALGKRIYTTQSDVWSFGILLWEIVTLGGTPYSGMKSRTLLRSLREGYRLPKPRNCEDDLYQMMLVCWQRRPDDRPTFSDLVEQLRSMMEDKSSYVNTENDDDFEYAVADSDDNDDIGDDDDAVTG